MSNRETVRAVSHLLFILALTLLFGSSCAPDDNERCGGGDDFVYEEGHCLKTEDTEVDSQPDGGPGLDSDSENGNKETDQNDGLGVICVDPEIDCNGLDASYCLKEPGAADTDEGICAIPNCTKQPDSCPQDYRCCAFVPMVEAVLGIESLCVMESIYDEVAEQTMGCDGDTAK